MRDFGQYLHALGRHWLSLVTGAAASLALLLWGVFEGTELPRRAFWVAAVAGVFLAGFLAWRDERRKLANEADAEQREAQRRMRALADKMVDEYVQLARPRHDAGPHALSRLGLHALKSDHLIREAIQEMHARSNTDPWSGLAHLVEDVDLVKFFERVQKMNCDFLRDGTVEDVARKVKAAAGHQPEGA